MNKDTNAKRLGALVGKRRRELGISMRSLAAATGIDTGTISRLEQGYYATPTPITLQKLSKTLDIPISELYAVVGYLTPDDIADTIRLAATTDGELAPEVQLALDNYLTHLRDEHGLGYTETATEPQAS